MKLRRLDPREVSPQRRAAVNEETLEEARAIVDDVRTRGENALREHAERFGDVAPGQPLLRTQDELRTALELLPTEHRELLERTASRIRVFAQAQRACLSKLDFALPGGAAGHVVAPIERAGCYAPGGRFPLPSSVLMTAVTARAAGVSEVWVASPRPVSVTLAAAALAGVDGFLAAGGAQAIAALAYGAGDVPACDAVVGPGNRWVTAAKQLVAGHVAIDGLAGPSELVVLADGTADADLVAADLLAQAEHDPDALPVVVTADTSFLARVEAALDVQLASLPTADVARQALGNGFAVVTADLEEAIDVCDRIAPEHLEVMTEDARRVASGLRHYGGLFVGGQAAEVFGDYGAGPNHVLPTGGTARFSGGLSVFDFLRIRTWLRVDDAAAAESLTRDAAALARIEGLEGHARAAESRRGCA